MIDNLGCWAILNFLYTSIGLLAWVRNDCSVECEVNEIWEGSRGLYSSPHMSSLGGFILRIATQSVAGLSRLP